MTRKETLKRAAKESAINATKVAKRASALAIGLTCYGGVCDDDAKEAINGSKNK